MKTTVTFLAKLLDIIFSDRVLNFICLAGGVSAIMIGELETGLLFFILARMHEKEE